VQALRKAILFAVVLFVVLPPWKEECKERERNTGEREREKQEAVRRRSRDTHAPTREAESIRNNYGDNKSIDSHCVDG
jgi:hypothetical protein